MTPAGNFRHSINIEQPSVGASDGMGNNYQGWAALYTGVMAEVRPLASQERWLADRTRSATTHQVRMRWLSGVTTEMRVVFGSRVFTITGVVNPEERNIELVLECTEG